MKPTRGSRILDLILTTEPDMIEDVIVCCPIANSDHNVLIWEVNYKMQMPKKYCVKYNYHKGNYKQINEQLTKVNWSELFSCKSVNEKWDSMRDILIKYRDEFVPVCKESAKKYPPWMKMTIRKEIKCRNRAWQKLRCTPNHQNLEKYKLLRNKVTSSIRSQKRNFESKLAELIAIDTE